MRRIVLAVVVALAACGGAPVHPRRLHVPSDVGQLVVDRVAFARFAAELRAQLDESKTDHLFVLAMLDALDEQWSAAVGKLDRIAAMSPHDPANTLRGLSIRVWADALASRGAFRDALAARVDALPKPVAAQLSELRVMAVVFTPDVCRQLVRDSVGPHVRGGTVPLEDAHAIVFQRYAVVRLVPVGGDIDAVLAARGIALPGD